MDASLHESTQQSLRPGKCVDIYYPDPQTARKQCFRTSVNTKFQQNFATAGAGTSQFTIPPNNGVQDIVIQMRYPSAAELAGGVATGLALPRAWGYAAINKVSFRVGGSNQFFLTGAQILQAALENCADAAARDSLYALGGSVCSTAANFTATNFAYVWLKLPWTTPSAEGKMVPLPSDLLTQQTIVTVELNPPSYYTSLNGTATSIPLSLMSANFTAQQVQFINQGDALARRTDMTSHSLSYPCEFIQQEVEIPLLTSSANQTVSITGFRSGEVKALKMWVTSSDDNVATAKNPLRWYRPLNLTCTYAGDVYSRFDADSSALWNLVNGKMVPEVAGSTLSYASSAYTATADSYKWVSLPFGQTYDVAQSAHSMYVSGKEILNGIVQVQLTLGADCASKAGLVLHVAPVYNSVLVFGSGTADFAF